MLSVVSVAFPFFALVLCGYVATRSGALALAAISGLNGFVLYFALPCMLYRLGAQTPLAQLLDPVAALLYLLCALVLVGTTVALTRRGAIGWSDAAFGALVVTFPNSGFMGIPLLAALLGERSSAPVLLTLALDMVVVTSLCIALSRLDGASGQGALTALRKALRGIAVNPMPWAIALGALASWQQWQLPQAIEQTVAMLAAAASPVALFTMGAVLARSHMHLHDSVAPRLYVPLALAKLVAQPLLLWLLGQAARALGAPLPDHTLAALVLVAALPSASNVVLLVERYGAHSGRVARVILVSTVLSFLSFPIAVAWMLPK